MPLLIDKPVGMSSHDVVATVRRNTGERTVGHAGTLDPLASGLLIILVGRAETRQQNHYLTMAKEYLVDITLGSVSTTDDAEGAITERVSPLRLSTAMIEKALAKFRGPIQQRPPVYSAIHVAGQRAYRLARQQQLQLTDLPVRQVTIHQLTLEQWQSPVLRLRVHCSHGTYIRSLARDLGEYLGVGGYVSALRRISIGSYRVTGAIPYEQIVLGQTALSQSK